MTERFRSLIERFNQQFAWRAELHARDVDRGVARGELPAALESKSPHALA